jgi:hypothetical protein
MIATSNEIDRASIGATDRATTIPTQAPSKSLVGNGCSERFPAKIGEVSTIEVLRLRDL